MGLNREQWKNWKMRKPCPHCQNGRLNPAQSKGFIRHETPDSVYMREYNAYEARYFFSLSLQCTDCGEFVIVTGEYEEPTSPIDEAGTWPRIVKPLAFIPTLHIFPIPAACPKPVRDTLLVSFALYWIDPPSAAGKVRIAVEQLMDSLIVSEAPINEIGKSFRPKLHQRLDNYAKVDPEIAGYLTSIKWIGNAGAHTNSLTQDDLLDAYSLLEHALSLLYSDEHMKLAALSKNINASKGPIRKS